MLSSYTKTTIVDTSVSDNKKGNTGNSSATVDIPTTYEWYVINAYTQSDASTTTVSSSSSYLTLSNLSGSGIIYNSYKSSVETSFDLSGSRMDGSVTVYVHNIIGAGISIVYINSWAYYSGYDLYSYCGYFVSSTQLSSATISISTYSSSVRSASLSVHGYNH